MLLALTAIWIFPLVGLQTGPAPQEPVVLDLTEDFELHAAWKGQATRLQAAGAKALSKKPTPEQIKMMGAIQIASKSLSTLVHMRAVDRPEDYETQVAGLREERQTKERELNRSLGLDEILATPTTQAMIDAIPEGGVLVDYAVKDHVFVWAVTSEGGIHLLYLGKAPEIEKLSEDFLADLVAKRGGRAVSTQAPSDLNDPLYQAIWNPIEELVAGREKILLCPDGFLGKLPFAVLKNGKGQYLLEEHDFIYLEDPTAHVSRVTEPIDPDGSFLAVGNVDYGVAFVEEAVEEEEDWLAYAGDVDLRAAMGKTWIPLEATDEETLTLVAMHRRGLKSKRVSGRLSGLVATEKRLKLELPKYNFLHLATHGFFEPMELEDQLPGLSAGLVCANANLPKKKDGEDGYLTAEEVALLDLQNCQMVVLSACETALGTVRAGEGLQSLRRAFAIAGADTVVSSCWKVGDESTAELMTSFYENLWVKRQSRSESLRNAQLKMLNHWRKQGTDGLPSTWGAFMLAGDWR